MSVAVGLLCLAPSAAAQDADAVAKQGIELYVAQRYAEAIPVFQRAHQMSPKAIFLYNIGRSQQRLGRMDDARNTFQTLLARADLLTGEFEVYASKARIALDEVKQAMAAHTPPEVPMVRFKYGAIVTGPLGEKTAVEPFEIDTFEVSALSYDFCVRAGRCKARHVIDPDNELPARGVNWADAANYCRFVRKRLPYEAEWERAALGETARPWPWGKAHDCTRANLKCSGSGEPVRSGTWLRDRTAEGVYDLGGNLSEWVQDWFSEIRAQQVSGPSSGVQRTVRGGSFEAAIHQAKSTERFSMRPNGPRPDVGFRCARSAGP